MELPRLLVLTCVLGVSAALFYARGAPAREMAPVTPAVVTASLAPAPTYTAAAPAPTMTTFAEKSLATNEHAAKPKRQKRRSHRR